MNIHCDDAAVATLLREMRDEMARAGARLHPDLTIHQRGADLWAACGAPELPSGPLIHLPAEVLIPVDALQWDEQRDLTPIAGLEQLTPRQRRLLDGMLAIYQATGKIEILRSRLPALALRDWPELHAYLARGRPVWAEHATLCPTQAFLKTREFQLPTATAEEQRRYLIPFFDYFNHHPDGSRYSRPGGGMAIAARRPGPTDECFACYGFRDVMALLLGMGYVDTQPVFVQSVVCVVALGEAGRLRITGQHGRIELADDLPALSFAVEGEVAISHFTLASGSGKRWRLFVDLLLRRVCPALSPAAREAEAVAVYEAIRLENVRYYAGLLERLDAHAPGQGAGLVAEMLGQAARHQLRILDRLAVG